MPPARPRRKTASAGGSPHPPGQDSRRRSAILPRRPITSRTPPPLWPSYCPGRTNQRTVEYLSFSVPGAATPISPTTGNPLRCRASRTPRSPPRPGRTWTAASDSLAWLTITAAANIGSGSVTHSRTANPAPKRGAALTIAGQARSRSRSWRPRATTASHQRRSPWPPRRIAGHGGHDFVRMQLDRDGQHHAVGYVCPVAAVTKRYRRPSDRGQYVNIQPHRPPDRCRPVGAGEPGHEFTPPRPPANFRIIQ